MFNNFKRLNSILILAIISFALLVSCMKEEKEKTKSMEDIQADEGIPVTIQKLEYRKFEKYLTFFAKLSGIKEASQGTNFGEKVHRVYANLGDYVKEGQVIIEFSSDLPQLPFTQYKIAFENTQKRLKRMKKLFEAGEISQQVLEDVQTAYEVNKRNFESTKQMIKVESPLNGILTRITVKEGEIPPVANPGQPRPLFTVSRLDVVKATINVTEQELILLKIGMPAIVISNGNSFKGKISEISPAMDPRTKAFKVELHFPNQRRLLKSGITTDLLITTYKNDSTIVLPRNLIKAENGKKYIFIESNGIAEKKYIITGKESGLNIEVLNGLVPGDRLITKGASLIAERDKIKVVED